MPKVSVIVPVFGVEKYIERCARSLFEQTLEDMEFVFVNDCTKDKSIDVLKKVIKDYPTRKHQIKIVNQPQNMGASRARERGVHEATGEYIGYCDSDDWVSLDMYEKMYEKAYQGGGVDYVKCGHYVSDGQGNDIPKSVYSIQDLINKENIISWLLTYKHWDSIWDTICRRKVYLENKIEFTDDFMLEDYMVSAQVLSYCNSFAIIQEPLYFYYYNPISICHLVDSKNLIHKANQTYNNVLKIIRVISDNFGERYVKEIIAIKSLPKHILMPAMTDYTNYRIWNNFFPEAKYAILLSPFIPKILRLRFLLVTLYLYPVYCKIKSIIYLHE